jgi:hypothetical protein
MVALSDFASSRLRRNYLDAEANAFYDKEGLDQGVRVRRAAGRIHVIRSSAQTSLMCGHHDPHID